MSCKSRHSIEIRLWTVFPHYSHVIICVLHIVNTTAELIPTTHIQSKYLPGKYHHESSLIIVSKNLACLHTFSTAVQQGAGARLLLCFSFSLSFYFYELHVKTPDCATISHARKTVATTFHLFRWGGFVVVRGVNVHFWGDKVWQFFFFWCY